jgi:hypothetical protein
MYGGPLPPYDGNEVSFSDAILGLIAGAISITIMYWCFKLITYIYDLIKNTFSFLIGLFN